MEKYSSLVRHAGNAGLFTAVEMSIVSALAGRPLHLHAEGLRGTGKTTILRAARDRLPRIERIKGCIYNCRPERPHCPDHRSLSAADIARLGVETVPMPFFEISHSAKVGTVIGSIDLAALTDRARPAAALLPGTLPRAHRGIIFVDEINRLADTSPDLADVLLDAMGTKPGRVQIEETGLPLVELPVEVTVWAASNPDEDPGPLADIRRQLSDRFDLTVSMGRPNRADIVTRILDLAQAAPESAGAAGERLSDACQEHATDGGAASQVEFPDAVALLPKVQWTPAVRQALADLYIDFGLESLRAVEAMQQAATLRCALTRRAEVQIADLAAVAGLALRHRVDLALLARITAHLQSLTARESPGLPDGDDRRTPQAAEERTQDRPLPAPVRPLAGDGGSRDGATFDAPPSAPASPGRPAPSLERGGFGRVLARILGGSGAAKSVSEVGPYPHSGAASHQGRTGSAEAPAGGPASAAGNAGQAEPVAAPPRPARSIFELIPDDVIALPEDVRRT
ncbi:MAG: magnesium chelatase [Chloroflexota bacterium]